MQWKISKLLTFIHADKSFLRNIQCNIESKILSGDFLHYVSSVSR